MTNPTGSSQLRMFEPESRKAPARRGGVRTGCNVGVDVDAPGLPVAGTGSLSKIRNSKRAPLRAAVLIGIHVLFLAHVAHYLYAGRTVSPVEPSESMYTLELGWMTAGFIFFMLAIVSTLVFGRFFCGWGCHIVAVQDLCAWMMKKLGVRPRPFRTRLLLLGPTVLAFYMFAWPSLRRIVFGMPPGPFPGFSNHLVTADFWRTFSGPLFASLTIVACGFAAVYVLGAKGFCTYGCPYGAIFGAADRFSVGRIVVSDACEQCGHCTATCTSNVRVHEEVRDFGMVVDPGCMKCTDCISVCPKGALSFQFAAPPIFSRGAQRGGPGPAPRSGRQYDLTLPEEIAAAVVGLGATLAFRGLYDGPPLLMAVGLGGISAFLVLKTWHLAMRRSVRFQNLTLKLDGAMRAPGYAFAAITLLWTVFTLHSGFVQWHRAAGANAIDRTLASREDVLSGASLSKSYPMAHAQAAADAYRHLSLADRWGLARVPEIELGLAWCHLLRGEEAPAEARIRAAIALAPRQLPIRQDLIDLLAVRGRIDDAIVALADKIALEEPRSAQGALTPALTPAGAGAGSGAETGPGTKPMTGDATPEPPMHERAASASGPQPAERTTQAASVDAGLGGPPTHSAPSGAIARAADHFALGTMLAMRERLAEAEVEFARAAILSPSSFEARFNRGGALRRLGRTREAVEELRAAAALDTTDADVQVELGLALQAEGEREAALAAFRRAIALAPDTPESREHIPSLIRELESAAPGTQP